MPIIKTGLTTAVKFADSANNMLKFYAHIDEVSKINLCSRTEGCNTKRDYRF